MKKNLSFLLCLFFLGCQSDRYKNVGDIPFDPQVDNEVFQLCNEHLVKQYYIRGSSDLAPSYPGEKRGLEKDILSKYSFPKTPDQNGYMTIRFIVNCHGKAGRYRIEEMDFDYKPYHFDTRITDQLLNSIKQLKDWNPRKSKQTTYDFYQFLSFKIVNGQIIKILP